MTSTYQPGDLVRILPEEYCPGCGATVALGYGEIVREESSPSGLLVKEQPTGPYYAVRVAHEHSTSSGNLVYAAAELEPYTLDRAVTTT